MLKDNIMFSLIIILIWFINLVYGRLQKIENMSFFNNLCKGLLMEILIIIIIMLIILWLKTKKLNFQHMVSRYKQGD